MLLDNQLGNGTDLLFLDLVVVISDEAHDRVLISGLERNAVVPLFEAPNLNNTGHVIQNNKGFLVPKALSLLPL